MKPLRALLPAPPLSLLKLGSYDDYRFQQAPPPPRPEYSVISCLFPISRTESFSSFPTSFPESSCSLQDEGEWGEMEEGRSFGSRNIAHPRAL